MRQYSFYASLTKCIGILVFVCGSGTISLNAKAIAQPNLKARELIPSWRSPASSHQDFSDQSVFLTLKKPEELNPNPNLLQLPTAPEDVQITQTIPITLEQAIALAKLNNRQLQITQEQLRRDRALQRQVRAQLFPTLSLQGGVTYQLDASSEISTNAQREQLTSQISDTQTAIQTLESAIPGITDPTQRTLLTLQLSQLQQSLQGSQTALEELDNFATTSLSGGLRLGYSLYSAQRNASLRQAREQVRLSEQEVQRLEEEVRLGVINAYYDLQDADSLIQIFQADIERRQRNLSDIQALTREGLATRLDLLNSQVELGNSEQNLLDAQNRRQTALSALDRILSIPPGVAIIAADPVETVDPWLLSLEDTILLALQNRVELEQQLTQRRIAEAQGQASRASTSPQVNLFAAYNVLNIATADSRTSAIEGFGDGYSVGLTMDWLLFDGGAARAGSRAAEANSTIAELQFADTSSQIRAETSRDFASMQTNAQNLQISIAQATRAEEALRIARLRFQAGVGIQTEVLDAEFRLTEAQGRIKTATLGYNRAIAALQRAVGIGF